MDRAAKKKVTFNLDLDIVDALSEAVQRGEAPGRSALVERALRRELKELRRRSECALWEAAMRDPLFLRDLAEVEEAFRQADADTARRIG